MYNEGIFNTSVFDITNSIVYFNGSNSITGYKNIEYSNLEQAFPGAGNISQDPKFMSSIDDYRLQSGSPCLDAASFAALPLDEHDLDNDGDLLEWLPIDIDGNRRVIGPQVDMGDYESSKCWGDVDGNLMINVTDLLALLAAWGPCASPCPPDTNFDGTVNVTDLLALLAAWGACP